MLPSSLPALSQPSPYADLYATQMGSKYNTTHWSQRYKQSKILDKSHSHPPLTSPVQMIAGNSFHSTGNQFSGSNTLNRRPPSAHSNSEPKLSVASRKSEMNG